MAFYLYNGISLMFNTKRCFTKIRHQMYSNFSRALWSRSIIQSRSDIFSKRIACINLEIIIKTDTCNSQICKFQKESLQFTWIINKIIICIEFTGNTHNGTFPGVKRDGNHHILSNPAFPDVWNRNYWMGTNAGCGIPKYVKNSVLPLY